MNARTKKDKLETKWGELGQTSRMVLRITLHSGEDYAIDLAGAQEGYPDPIMPWGTFVQQRVEQVLGAGPTPLPECILQLKEATTGQLHETLRQETGPTCSSQLDAMNRLLTRWSFRTKVALKKLWTMPGDEFKEKAAGLVDFVEWSTSRQEKSTGMHAERGKQLMKESPDEWVFER